jgi:hypothetical protein
MISEEQRTAFRMFLNLLYLPELQSLLALIREYKLKSQKEEQLMTQCELQEKQAIIAELRAFQDRVKVRLEHDRIEREWNQPLISPLPSTSKITDDMPVL